MQYKYCSICKIDKPISDFNRKGCFPDGSPRYRSECRMHQKEYRRQWYLKNRNSELAKAKEHWQNNKEELRAANKKYWQDNKDILSSEYKDYYQAHLEEIKSRKTLYNIAHREDISEYNCQYRSNNRERLAENRRKVEKRYVVAKYRAKERNKEFNLSFDEYFYEVSKPCYYCNGYFGKVEAGCGLDRLDNEKGYITNNVVSCCATCNKLKGAKFSPEETLAAITAIINVREKGKNNE